MGRRIPIHVAATQVPLFLGADRGLVVVLATIAGALVSTYRPVAMAFGVGLWFVGLWGARALARVDPRYVPILVRALPGKYQRIYRARSTPWRVNSRHQVRGYRR